MADRININYSGKNYDVYTTKELKKELEKIFSKDDWNYLKLMNLFEINTKNLEELFDNEKGVLVMSEDNKIRENRLNLLGVIRNYSLKIIDFTLL